MLESFKKDAGGAVDAVKAAALAKVNQEKSWASANKGWLIALGVAVLIVLLVAHFA